MYIDKAYYNSLFPSDITEAEFLVLADGASDIINDMTFNRINFFGLSAFSVATQDAIKKACANQVNLLYSQGGESALNGVSDGSYESVSIGRYSQGGKSSQSYQTVNGVPISPAIKRLLKYTNLLYPATGTYRLDFFN